MKSHSFLVRTISSIVLLSTATLWASFAFGDDHLSDSTLDQKKVWTETGMTFSQVQTFYSKKLCEESIADFLTCVEMIQNALTFAEPSETIVSAEEYAQNRSKYNAIVHDFHSVVIVESKPAEKDKVVTALQAWKKVEEGRNHFHSMWTPKFNNGTSDVDFDGILAWIPNAFKSLDVVAKAATGAINTYMANHFDPHTRIAPKALYDEMSKDSTNFFGIGAELGKIPEGPSKDKIVLVSVMDKSPALAAGLQANDQILAVDGKETSKLSIIDVIKLIRGAENTNVVLKIARNGKTRDYSVKRGKVSVENVKAQYIEDRSARIGYITLTGFMSDQACGDLAKAIYTLYTEHRINSLILNLRNNGGGRLDKAVCIASLFLPSDQPVVKVKPLDSKNADPRNPDAYYTLDLKGPFPAPFPMIVLINGGSASASEILSGALQDHARALILGDRSYGKGSVQAVHEKWDQNPKFTFLETFERFYLPSGRSNQITGIIPDVQVYTKPNPTEDEKFTFREENTYTNALPAQGQPWVQPRSGTIGQVTDCMSSSGKADGLYKSQAQRNIPDYQLLKAQDAMNCILDKNLKTFFSPALSRQMRLAGMISD